MYHVRRCADNDNCADIRKPWGLAVEDKFKRGKEIKRCHTY